MGEFVTFFSSGLGLYIVAGVAFVGGVITFFNAKGKTRDEAIEDLENNTGKDINWTEKPGR